MKFKVGDIVTVNAGTKFEKTETIVRTNELSKSGTGYYYFDNGTGAYEWSIQPTIDLVSPHVAATRILDAFKDRIQKYQITVTTMEHSTSSYVDVNIWTHNQHFITFQAWTNEDGLVDTCSSWKWYVDNRPNGCGSDVNLGSAIVSAYNRTLEKV